MDILTRKLIRPRRGVYTAEELGPVAFRVNGVVARRDDCELRNPRGLRIVCSWFHPVHNAPVPCLIYCHGNCGTRLDSTDIMTVLVPLGISVFTFDFAGSGLSDGEIVSLGYYEQDDIRTVVEYVRKMGRVKTVSIWGRSMGAVAALLYASHDHDLNLLILDSPFTSLSDIIKDQISKLKWVPTSLSLSIMNKIRKRIFSAAGFDIDEVNPMKAVSRCWAPCFFIHSVEDELISIEHSIRLAAAYPSRFKKLHKAEGGHNALRPLCLVELLGKTIHKFSRTSPFNAQPIPHSSRFIGIKSATKRAEALPMAALDTAPSPRTATHRSKGEGKIAETDTSF